MSDDFIANAEIKLLDPSTRITFILNDAEGWFDWKDGKITFGGDLDASAAVLFEYVTNSIRPWIDKQLEKR